MPQHKPRLVLLAQLGHLNKQIGILLGATKDAENSHWTNVKADTSNLYKHRDQHPVSHNPGTLSIKYASQ